MTTTQIDKLKKDFSRAISNFSDMGVSDYEYSDGKIRVYVEFGFCLREVDIKTIEVLNEDYDVIEDENTLIIKNFIKKTIEDYNADQESLEARLAEEQEYRNHIMFGLYY